MSDPNAPPPSQPNNPLHGVTLEQIVTELSEYYGWPELGHMIPIRCFNFEPSVSSSLKFLRRTPWARQKVEKQYLIALAESEAAEAAENQAKANNNPPAP